MWQLYGWCMPASLQLVPSGCLWVLICWPVKDGQLIWLVVHRSVNRELTHTGRPTGFETMCLYHSVTQPRLKQEEMKCLSLFILACKTQKNCKAIRQMFVHKDKWTVYFDKSACTKFSQHKIRLKGKNTLTPFAWISVSLKDGSLYQIIGSWRMVC